jgi:hypothetical protein
MKTISKNAKNRVYLEDPTINSEKYTVKYSIIDRMGDPAKDSENADITDKTAEREEESGKVKFYAEWKFKPSTVTGKYYRLVFSIFDMNENFVVSDFSLIEMGIEVNRDGIQLCPIDYFKEYVLGSNLSDEIKQKLITYPKDALEEFLLSGRDFLEDDLEISFTPKTVESEAHDWNGDWIYDTFWQVQLRKFPVISVQNYSLWYGTQKIIDIDTSYLQLKKEMGIVEWVPVVGQPLFQLYQSTLEAMSMTLALRTGAARVPDVFRVSYTHGLNFTSLESSEQAAITLNIGRKAMLFALGRISPDVIKGSESQSMDGVSYSSSNRGIEWLEFERSELKDWIEKGKRKYNTQLKIVCV